MTGLEKKPASEDHCYAVLARQTSRLQQKLLLSTRAKIAMLEIFLASVTPSTLKLQCRSAWQLTAPAPVLAPVSFSLGLLGTS
jgi:hypothetical protein